MSVSPGDLVTKGWRRSGQHSGAPNISCMWATGGLQTSLLRGERRPGMHLVSVIHLRAMHQKIGNPLSNGLQANLLQTRTKCIRSLFQRSHRTLSNNSMPTNGRINNLNGTSCQPISEALGKISNHTLNIRLHAHRQLTRPNSNQANTSTPRRHVIQHGFLGYWTTRTGNFTVGHNSKRKSTNQHQHQKSEALVEKLIYLDLSHAAVLLLLLGSCWLQSSTSDAVGA